MKLVADHYSVEPSDATLVRSFSNDVFRIDADDQSYALKIYGAGRFTADEVRWEQQLAHELASTGLPVAADVALTSGDSVGTLDAPEGQRLFALTEWVPGDKPQPPWSNALYRTVGASLARLHLGADSFTSSYPRQSVRRGDEPKQVVAALDGCSDRKHLVQRTATAAQTELERLASRGLQWGIRHGDPSLDNIHVDEGNALYFYDLDLAGHGWQVEDLAGALSTEFADPFLEGYVSERPLPAGDLEALPWLRILGHIDNLKFHLIDKPAAMGSSTLSEGWVDRGFEGLANAARDAGVQPSETAR
jgi:Ser/Thr protein kinase RdoA (MazF antagonist)